jgi:membrane-associated HD superfamily phosphohydrolase
LILSALVAYVGLNASRSGISHTSLLFALPYAAITLVVQSIGGNQRGLLTTVCATVLYGFYLNADAMNLGLLTAMILTSGIVACLVFQRGVRSRSAYLRGAMWITASMIPFALASLVIAPVVGPLDGAVRLLGCFVSGALSALLAVAVTPIIEYLTEYASDMRLIEMATLDHPLLKELSIQAPGTWNHSMVIGMMVESAASAIGANPVVCRVGAYFHDIGKTKKPLYLVLKPLAWACTKAKVT